MRFILDNLLSLSIFTALLVFTVYANVRAEGRVYDCRFASYHPDVPVAVREQCRQLQYDSINSDRTDR